jgi:predicted branched-subunit amino acid permease
MSTLADAAEVAAASDPTPFREGVREAVPFLVGVAPLALAIGATLAASDVPTFAGWLAGPAIFGGAAQLMTIQMLDAGALPWVIVLSAVIVNSRVLIYGAALAPWFAHATLRTRLLVSIPVIDPLFFQVQPRFAKGDLSGRGRTAYYAGAAALLTGGWMAVQAVGIAAGDALPGFLHLEMAAALVFAGFVANVARTRPAVAAATVAGIVAVAGSGLPFQTGLSVAIVSGLVGGSAVSRVLSHAKDQS